MNSPDIPGVALPVASIHSIFAGVIQVVIFSMIVVTISKPSVLVSVFGDNYTVS